MVSVFQFARALRPLMPFGGLVGRLLGVIWALPNLMVVSGELMLWNSGDARQAHDD